MAKNKAPKITDYKEVFKDVPALLDKKIHTKPLTFKEDVGNAGCEKSYDDFASVDYSQFKDAPAVSVTGDTYLYNRTTDPKPTPGIPYPEAGETGICDVEITKTRWKHVTAIIITLAVTSVIAYAIHAAYLIKLASR